MKYRSFKITESQINRVINETLSELLHKKHINEVSKYNHMDGAFISQFAAECGWNVRERGVAKNKNSNKTGTLYSFTKTKSKNATPFEVLVDKLWNGKPYGSFIDFLDKKQSKNLEVTEFSIVFGKNKENVDEEIDGNQDETIPNGINLGIAAINESNNKLIKDGGDYRFEMEEGWEYDTLYLYTTTPYKNKIRVCTSEIPTCIINTNNVEDIALKKYLPKLKGAVKLVDETHPNYDQDPYGRRVERGTRPYQKWDLNAVFGNKPLNESKGNNIQLSLHIGYNYHVNNRSAERIDDWVIFQVVCRDTNNDFVETIASYSCRTPEDFNKPTFDVMVHTSNFSDDSEEIISELGGGQRRDFAYDDEPEQVFRRSKCNIKPFVMEHLKEGLNNFKNDTYYPEWQKKRAYAILNKCGIIGKEPLKEKVDDTIFQVNILRSGQDDERAFVTPYDGKRQGIINGTKWCVYTGTRQDCVQWADNYNNKHNYKCLQERTASEEGMTDDEVRKKRTLDFINSTNWERSVHDNPADDDLFLAGKDRYRKHLDAQKGSRFTKKAEKTYKTGKM